MNSEALLTFLGDVAFFKSLDNFYIDPSIINIFSNAFVVLNLEFPFSIKKIPAFSFSYEEYIASYKQFYNLRKLNVNLCSLANNHINDWGIEGINATKSLLKKNGIRFFGAGKNLKEARKPIIVESANLSFGFIGYCKKGIYSAGENSSGPAVIDKDQIIEDILKLKYKVDHIIINLHWGVEFSNFPMPSDIELAHSLIENGASLIIGHHPHVIQGYEKYKGGLIFYSLGNFIYDPWSERIFVDKKIKERTESIIVKINFSKTKIEDYEIIPTKITKNRTLRLMYEEEKEDFFYRINYLNENLYNSKAFYCEVADNLIERELKTYFKLFISNPLDTILLFIKNFKLRYIKMSIYFFYKKVIKYGR